MTDGITLDISRVLTIPEHHHSIRQCLDLTEAMRNVHDGNSLGREILNDLEELFGFVLTQAGGGFIHDQYAGID